jgi:hypothetical protein
MAIYRGPGGAGDATADATNAAAIANGYATAAAASASTAAGSATNAATSATNAANSATSASNSATAAASSASGASTSETNAASSASAAAASATTANNASNASINLATNFNATATTLSAGSSATASYNSGTYTLTLGIPTGATGATGATGSTGATGATGPEGLRWLGAYAGGTAYIVDDAVSYNGSSYICKLASTGNLPTNTTYWDVLAAQGAAGSGSGDVTGPASSTDNTVARFDGTTGKIIQTSGVVINDSNEITVGIWKGTEVGVSYGGTGASTLTGIVKGNGTSAFTAATAGTDYLAPAAIGTTVQAYDSNLNSFVNTFTLPTTDGTNGQVLQTNGSGTLAFATPSAGVTTGKAIAMALIFGF